MNMYFINIGEDPSWGKPPTWIDRRNWESCLEYGFYSAGQGVEYSKPLFKLNVNDLVAAYITGRGYVGIGRVIQKLPR